MKQKEFTFYEMNVLYYIWDRFIPIFICRYLHEILIHGYVYLNSYRGGMVVDM